MTSGGLFAVAAGTLVLCLVLLSRFRPAAREAGPLGDSGSSAMELVFVFPILLSMVMVIAQCTHLLFAALLVEHAAFCVARSASVQIPKAQSGEGINRLSGGDSTKLRTLTKEAANLLAPSSRMLVSGGRWRMSAAQYLQGAFLPRPDDMYGATTILTDLALRRGALELSDLNDGLKFYLNLAQARVEVRNQNEAHGGTYPKKARSFQPSEILDVTVVFEYPLDVPAGGNIMGPLIGYVPFGNNPFSRALARALGIRYRVDIRSTFRVLNWGQEEAQPKPAGRGLNRGGLFGFIGGF